MHTQHVYDFFYFTLMNKMKQYRFCLLAIILLFSAFSVFSQNYSAEYIKKRDALIQQVRVDFDSIILNHPRGGLAFIKEAFQSYKDDSTIKAWSYHLIADYYARKDIDDSTFFYLEKSLQTIEAKEAPLLFSRNKTQIAIRYAGTGQFEKSLKLLNEAKKEINDKSSNIIQFNYYDVLGQYYHYQSEYTKAIENYNLAEKHIMKEPPGDKKDNLLARSYTNIGSVITDRKKAVAYYKKARVLLENKDIEGEHYCDLQIVYLNEKGSSQLELNNLDTAIQYFKRVGGKRLAVRGMISRANVFAVTGSKKRAEALYLEGLELSKSNKNESGISSISNRLGILYNEMGQFNKAIKYALKSLDSKSQRIDMRLSNLETLHKAYKSKKDYKNAHFYMEKFLVLKEKSQYEEEEKIVDELETKYESEKKQLQIQSLEKENTFIKQRRWLLAGLTALFFLIPILYLSQRSKKRKKIYQAEMAQMQLASLKSQMSPHFMFNSINTIKGMIIDDTAEAAADQLTKFSKFMRNILNYSGGEFISLKDEINFLQQYSDLENFKREFRVNVSFSGAKELAEEEIEVLPFLLQPFLENSFKHAFKRDSLNPKIDVKFTKQGDWLQVLIKDNGIGEKRNASMEHISKGTLLVKNRLSLHNGVDDNVNVIYNGLNKGTTVSLKLKI